MINILLDRLPQYTKNGHKIRTDFREYIKFELLMQDNKLSPEEKINITLQLFYYEPYKIKNVKEAIDDVLWFYACGKRKYNDNKEEKQNENKINQIYSYEFDDEYIYSAFMEQYEIDLNDIKYLHWWKFKALFKSLNKDIKFVQIMSYRSTDISKLKDKENIKFYKKMKELYKLPDMRNEKEKEMDFANALW